MVEKSTVPLAESTRKELLNYYNKGVFSESSLAWHRPDYLDDPGCLVTCGESGSIVGVENQSKELIFDLASLTKPLVTSLCILHLIEEGVLHWNGTIGDYLEARVPLPLSGIDVFSLLTHSSGLAAHRDFWRGAVHLEEGKRKKWLLDTLLQERPEYGKGEYHIYSDLGYMLLGFLIEQKTGRNIAEYWTELIAEPLAIQSKVFFPASKSFHERNSFAPTGTCRWSGAELRGLVHDDNSRATGGISGHAGLFGTASAVMVLCVEILKLCREEQNRLPISAEIFRQAVKRVGDSEWSAGFNLPSPKGSSSGRNFSSPSLGHLGFTGTSFWLDPVQGFIVVLLTNRVAMGEDMTGIRELRPRLHDIVTDHLGDLEQR